MYNRHRHMPSMEMKAISASACIRPNLPIVATCCSLSNFKRLSGHSYPNPNPNPNPNPRSAFLSNRRNPNSNPNLGIRSNMGSWLEKAFGIGTGSGVASASASADSSIAQGPDDDAPPAGQQFAQFGAGCFWGVELAFQRVPGVTKTEVGYTQGMVHNPSYNAVCSGNTGHSEVVRVLFDPKDCSYEDLLRTFWGRHDPTTLNRQVKALVKKKTPPYM